MKRIRIFAILALLVFPIFQLSAQNSRQLVIYTWEEMFPQAIFDNFKRATGIEVILKTFEENEEMLLNLESTDGGGYDLVIADDYIIDFIVAEDLAQKLNKRSLRNYGNINYIFQHQFYDPDDEYTVPYGSGVQTIVYDPSKTPLDIKGYSDLWDPGLRSRVGIIGNYRVVNGMALKTLGKSYNTEEVADINSAGQKLNSLAPNIRTIKDMGLDRDLVSGNISVGVMYTDQVMKSKLGDPAGGKGNPNLKIVFPKEGIGFGIMAAFIPKRAANVTGAHLFLDFIMDPQRGAQCFEYLGYYCTFKASEQFISPEKKEYLILPDFKNFEMIQNLPQDAEEAHDRIWQSFKTRAQGSGR